MSESATTRLRAAGLRITPGRAAAIETLQSLGGHRTVDEVAKGLAERGVKVARATVFNVLGDLATAGLVTVADAGPGAARYEVATTGHHHFVCTECASIADVPCAAEGSRCLDPVVAGGTVTEIQVTYRGICNNCAARR